VRVLYFIPRYHPATGGAGVWARELLKYVAREHDVAVVAQWREDTHDYVRATTVLAPQAPYDDVDDGIPVHVIAPRPPYRGWLADLSRIYDRCRLIRPLFYALYRATLLPQLTAHVAGYDLVHAVHIGLIYSAEIALAAARLHHLPFVFTPFPHQGGWGGQRFRRLYRMSDAVIAMTTTEKEWLIARGADPLKVHVVGGGPVLAATGDGNRFRECYHLTGPIILFIGQRLKHKGYTELLAAMPAVWTRHPDAHLVFIGPMTPEAQPIFAEATRDPRVTDLGIVDTQTKTDALDASSMLCVPSTQESFGLVYVEAWSLGKPVIAAHTDVTQNVVDAGVDGLLVPQTPADIAAGIMRLLDSPDRAAEMGRHGRLKAESYYGWESIGSQMTAIYTATL